MKKTIASAHKTVGAQPGEKLTCIHEPTRKHLPRPSPAGHVQQLSSAKTFSRVLIRPCAERTLHRGLYEVARFSHKPMLKPLNESRTVPDPLSSHSTRRPPWIREMSAELPWAMSLMSSCYTRAENQRDRVKKIPTDSILNMKESHSGLNSAIFRICQSSSSPVMMVISPFAVQSTSFHGHRVLQDRRPPKCCA